MSDKLAGGSMVVITKEKKSLLDITVKDDKGTFKVIVSNKLKKYPLLHKSTKIIYHCALDTKNFLFKNKILERKIIELKIILNWVYLK
jgi:hypothetical protein